MNTYEEWLLPAFKKHARLANPEWTTGGRLHRAMIFLWMRCTDKNGFDQVCIGDAMPELRRMSSDKDEFRRTVLRAPHMGPKSFDVLVAIIEKYKLLE